MWSLQLKTRVSAICEPVPAGAAGCLGRTAEPIVAYSENGSAELFLLPWESNWYLLCLLDPLRNIPCWVNSVALRRK